MPTMAKWLTSAIIPATTARTIVSSPSPSSSPLTSAIASTP